MTRLLSMLGAITLMCWPALSDPAHIEAHRVATQKREKLWARKAMNQQEVDELRKEWK
jgi:hypothetical protein